MDLFTNKWVDFVYVISLTCQTGEILKLAKKETGQMIGKSHVVYF